jgi:NAD(P)-dependent dehydrogenase (short-subunit alcohol dehydrogenase family)
VLVTGCSAGIGLATATLLASRGWRVFATTRNPGKEPDLSSRISGQTGRVEIVGLDLTDSMSIDTAVGQVFTATGGELYGVVHNGGIGDAGFFEDMSDQAFRHVLETNFFGVVALTRATLPTMRRACAGRFVMVSSAAVFFPNPWQTAYTASKSALEGWAESLALEVRPFGIQLAVVEPGMHRTGMWDSALISRRDDSPYRLWLASLEPQMRELARRRGGDPRKVASVVARALESPRVRLRYPVGLDAWGARFVRLLPETARRSVRRAVFGMPVMADTPPAPRSG